jgi:hypothetical protein
MLNQHVTDDSQQQGENYQNQGECCSPELIFFEKVGGHLIKYPRRYFCSYD